MLIGLEPELPLHLVKVVVIDFYYQLAFIYAFIVLHTTYRTISKDYRFIKI